jgi:hypothetical protein
VRLADPWSSVAVATNRSPDQELIAGQPTEATMGRVARKDDPALWARVKGEVTEGDKGGRPGQWSARKAQLATQEYKSRGGGYVGQKAKDNSLGQWTEEEWGTKSGRKSAETGERYLPKRAREGLSDEEYRRTTAKKRADTRRGEQFSRQPQDVARKTAGARRTGKRDGGGGREPSRAELYERAKRQGGPGRSKMSKGELRQALGG